MLPGNLSPCTRYLPDDISLASNETQEPVFHKPETLEPAFDSPRLMGKLQLCALLGRSSAVDGMEKNGSEWRFQLK